MPSPHAPPSKKVSGEQSRVSWVYSQKVARTNEVVRSLAITSTSHTTVTCIRVSATCVSKLSLAPNGLNIARTVARVCAH